MKITSADRARALRGANTPICTTPDGYLTAFLQPDMRIVIRRQVEFENPQFSGPMSQRAATAILESWEPD